MGSFGQRLRRSEGRRREPPVQNQGVRRRLPDQGDGRQREESDGQSQAKAGRDVQPLLGGQKEDGDKQAGGKGQRPMPFGGQEGGIRRIVQIRQVRRRGRQEGKRPDQPGKNRQGPQIRRIQPHRVQRDEHVEARDIPGLPPALEDRGHVQDHEVGAGRQTGVFAEKGIHLRAFPNLLLRDHPP